jgi:hypothetical protein
MAWSFAFLLGVASADVPRDLLRQDDSLQAVLDRIHRYAGSDAWQKDGISDDKTEAWLAGLVGKLAKAAAFPELKVPVQLAEVKTQAPAQAAALQSALLVGKDLDLKAVRLSNCIVLSDGNVELGRAYGCVIIARRTITVRQSSQYCVLAAGLNVTVSGYDGQPGSTENGSVILSRGWVTIAGSYGSIIAAREGVTVSRPHGTLFVNTEVPKQRVSNSAVPSKSIQVADLSLERIPEHPLANRVEISGVVTLPDEASPLRLTLLRQWQDPTGVVFRFQGRRYVAGLQKPLVDESGEEVQGLKGWKLSHVDEKIAVFSTDEADAVLRIANK